MKVFQMSLDEDSSRDLELKFFVHESRLIFGVLYFIFFSLFLYFILLHYSLIFLSISTILFLTSFFSFFFLN